MTLTPGLIGKPTAVRLGRIAGDVPADQCVVEIGVFLARTTAFLATGALAGNGAHVYGIDPWDLPGERYPYQWLNDGGRKRRQIRQMFTLTSTREQAEQLISDAGLEDQVTLIREFSTKAAAEWDGPLIGLLMVDGDHRPEHVRADWEAWRHHLAPDAVIAWDDYHPGWPGVKQVVDELVANREIVLTEVIERRNGALALTHADT